MSADKRVVNELVTIIGPESKDFKTTLGAVIGVGTEGKPEADAAHARKNYPTSLSYHEEFKAAVDFSSLEVLPILPEFWKVHDLLRRIEKGSKPKSNGAGDSVIEPIDLQALKGVAS